MTAFSNMAFIAEPNNSSFRSIAPMINAVPARSNVWDVSDDGQVLVGDMSADPVGMTMQSALVWKPDGSYRPLALVMK